MQKYLHECHFYCKETIMGCFVEWGFDFLRVKIQVSQSVDGIEVGYFWFHGGIVY
jgi:hypothetical protein